MAGNKGYSFFSEKAFNDLKKAIDIMTKLENISKSERLNAEKRAELFTRYKSQLEDLDIKQSDTLKSLQREYDIEKDIYEQKVLKAKTDERARKAKEKEEKQNKITMQWEKDFADEIADRSKEEIANQQKLNKIKEDGLKAAKDLRRNDETRNELLKKYSKMYRDEVERQKKVSRLQNNLSTAFGVSNSNIQDVKDGSFIGKKAAEIFSKAVGVFASAVKAGIDKNYNTAEETLNSITASNRISWNRGHFSVEGKDYFGYKQINNAVNDQLLSEGLFNNIDNTEVLKATAQLTSSGGFSLEEAIAKGYQDTVIKYIVPYLDTSSEAYESLEMLMPRYF